MKTSRAKIWIRTGLLAVFVLCFPIGMWLSRLVPMQAESTQVVTLSFDRVYFVVIWLLVIARFILAHIPGMNLAADISMCAILGITSGRLGDIGLRVRGLTNNASIR